VLGKFCDWLDHRTGYRKLRDALLIEHIPGGAKWRYVWGSCLAFVFLVQLITGVLLMTAYSPGDSTAWGSVYYIQYEMDFGWLIRGLHHFGSQTMVVLLGIHMLQVVIAGAHLPPREVNWWLGLCLMGVVLGLSLTGYLLPWDQKGFWATQVATNILGNIPLVGAFLQKLIVGGPEYGHQTLTHFYSLHVGILPPLMIVLIIAHLAVFRRHGVTAPPKAQGEGMFWPAQAFKDMVVSMLIFGVMLALVVFGGYGNAIDTPESKEAGWFENVAKAGRHGLGANLDAPADPATPSYPARPEWYFLSLFQLLKYFKADQEIIGTVVIPTVIGLLLFVLPLLGYGRLRKFGHFFGVVVVVTLLAGAGLMTFLAVADDSPEPILGVGGKGKKLQQEFAQAKADAQRAVNLAHFGIPQEGGRELLRKDPLTRGRKLFKEKCASCHNYSTDRDLVGGEFMITLEALGPNKKKVASVVQELTGKEADDVEKMIKTTLSALQDVSREEGEKFKKQLEDAGAKVSMKNRFKASDLAGYATEKWIQGFLKNPGDSKYFGLTELTGMKKWRRNIDDAHTEWKKTDPDDVYKKKVKEQGAEFDLLARFLADQAKPKAKRDARLFQDGIKIFFAKKPGACSKCHNIAGGKREGGSDGPDFTNYGSQEWIRLMVMSPANPARHANNNKMPAFLNLDGPGAEVHEKEFRAVYGKTMPVMNLIHIDRELIIRWLTGDFRVVFGGDTISGPPK
jgi:quinol-cytochrome oxidoreductase complex cytochrome b subunit